ncbi:MAG: hypothetical protein WCC38_17735 [Pseudonocardiaceae bacterium]
MQPAQPGPRVVHREQVLDEWDEFGLDAAGAVVEEFGEFVGEGAARTQVAGVELAFMPAA